MRCTVFALFGFFAAIPLRADEKIDIDKGVEQAKAVAKAVLDEDYNKLVDGTHPKVVEIMGGKEKMIETTKVIMKNLKDMGFKFKSHTVGKPHEPVIDGKTAYLVLPTTLELTTPDSKIVTESYLLGMTTDGGKTWVFVDGAGMEQKAIKDKVFPKLPEGLKLPEKKPPTVTPEKEKDK
jgi:hypothetical protein